MSSCRRPTDERHRDARRRHHARAAEVPERPSPRGGRWVATLAVVALLAAVVWLVWFSPVLSVRSVKVLGTTATPTDAVVAAADVPLGTPLARVDVAGVTARVSALPRVASVEVRRGVPSELVVVVTERTPVAVVPEGGGYATVDVTGVRLGRVAAKPRSLPVVTATGEGRRAALAVVGGLPRDLLLRVIEVRGDTPDAVELRIGGGATVRWGDAGRGDRKADVLRALLSVPASRYDVSAPDLPTTTR